MQHINKMSVFRVKPGAARASESQQGLHGRDTKQKPTNNKTKIRKCVLDSETQLIYAKLSLEHLDLKGDYVVHVDSAETTDSHLKGLRRRGNCSCQSNNIVNSMNPQSTQRTREKLYFSAAKTNDTNLSTLFTPHRFQ